MNLSTLSLCLLLTLGICQGSIVKDVRDLGRCGGAIVADQGNLTFPLAGQTVVPGEVCVWTIHLDTMEDFRLNFTSLNVSSATDECTNAGVRVYSLSNLETADNQESYTFCLEKPPADAVFLSKLVATVVFYTSKDSIITSDTGFNLNWEGTSFDPFSTKHLSSILTASTELINYPINGGYESNTVATWLVEADSPTNSSLVDISLESLLLETCGNTDNTCFCDALILYEVTSDGLLIENQRFCKNVIHTILMREVSNKFILAFFTDSETQPSVVGGFELNYYPSGTITTTTTARTTTTEASTTTEYPFPISKDTCGEILVSSRGKISYKTNDTYGIAERCIWTIRAPGSTQILFNLIQSDFPLDSNVLDAVFISSFSLYINRLNATDESMHETAVLKSSGSSIILNGTVAIVTFASDHVDDGENRRGFELEFFGNVAVNGDVSAKSTDYILSELTGSISYPLDNVFYGGNELSTFVFAAPSYNQTFWSPLRLQIESKGGSALQDLCYDQLRIYNFKGFLFGFDFHDRLCNEDLNSMYEYGESYITVVVFFSDEYIAGQGFNISWDWEMP